MICYLELIEENYMYLISYSLIYFPSHKVYRHVFTY